MNKGLWFNIRNTLNIIFILMVPTGGLVMYLHDWDMGVMILMLAVFVKLTETAMRIIFKAKEDSPLNKHRRLGKN